MLKTKTFWVGIITIASGAVMLVFDEDRSKGTQTILAGLGMIFVRHAIKKGR
jgi:hypothetical protein